MEKHTANEKPIATSALDRIATALISAGIFLTLLNGGFLLACRVAGVTSGDLYSESGQPTGRAPGFCWFYEHILAPTPWLALAGFPFCIGIAVLSRIRGRRPAATRAWSAAGLTIVYASLWGAM